MQLRNHLEHTRDCLLNLIDRPYFNAFLQSQDNFEDLHKECHFILENINRALMLDDNEISEHYEALTEFSYSAKDFFETLSENSSMFASTDICQMFTLNPPINSFKNYFKEETLKDTKEILELKAAQKSNKTIIVLDGNISENINDETLAQNILNSLTEVISLLYDILQERKQLKLSMVNDIESILMELENINIMKKNGNVSKQTKIELLTILERVGIIFLHQDVEKIILKINKN